MLQRYERETIINFTDGDDTVNIYSTKPEIIKKLKKNPGWVTVGAGVSVDIPKENFCYGIRD